MNNNKRAASTAFIVVCGKVQEWKSEAGHRYVRQAISPCYGILFACVFAGCDLVSWVQLAHRPVLNESEDRWSANLGRKKKIDLAYILTPSSQRPLAFVASSLAGLSTCQLARLLPS